jgi:hypothetical protein
MSARRWAEFLVPDALGIHIDWLRELVQGEDGMLAHVTRSSTAARMLTRRLYQRHGISAPARTTLAPHQQWLLSGQTQQVALARELGIEALNGFIRTTVDAPSVAILRKTLGEETYRRILAAPGLEVSGMERTAFAAALRAGRLDEHFVSAGAALLETTTRTGDPFCRMRMRFAFSPGCWRSRPQGIGVDERLLADRITQLTGG